MIAILEVPWNGVAPDLPPLERGEVVVHPVEGDPVRVRVELAVTDEQRQFGLMCRRELAADAGMLFLFPPPGASRLHRPIPGFLIFPGDGERWLRSCAAPG